MLREIVLDTETTGLDPRKGDRLIEIGCIELVNRIPTGEGYAADATATGNTNNGPVGHSLLVQTLSLGLKGKF